MKTIAIKNKNIMKELVKRGYELLNVCENWNSKDSVVYIFYKTDELMNDFYQILEEIKRNKENNNVKFTKDELNILYSGLSKLLSEFKDDKEKYNEVIEVIRKVDILQSAYIKDKTKSLYNIDISEIMKNVGGGIFRYDLPDYSEYLKYIKR